MEYFLTYPDDERPKATDDDKNGRETVNNLSFRAWRHKSISSNSRCAVGRSQHQTTMTNNDDGGRRTVVPRSHQRTDWTFWTEWTKTDVNLGLDVSNFVSLSPTIPTNVPPTNSPRMLNNQKSGCCGGLAVCCCCCCCCCCGSISSSSIVRRHTDVSSSNWTKFGVMLTSTSPGGDVQ